MNASQRRRHRGGERSLSMDKIAQYMSQAQSQLGRYQGQPATTLGGDPTEEIEPSFRALVQRAYAENGVVFSCMLARQLLFAEARFGWQEYNGGLPGDFVDPGDSLKSLGSEKPWQSPTTRRILVRMEQDASLAGNSFHAWRPRTGRVVRCRPDWIKIVKGSETDSELDAEVIGYAYFHNGTGKPEIILPDHMAHYAPIPDPLADFRGMSWLTPVIRTIEADEAAETHKRKFFDNGATPNMLVKLDADLSPEEFKEWVAVFEADHAGVLNAYKTLYLGGGSDATVIGKDLQQIDFKKVIAAGETRIAAAAGVPAIVAGLSEGMENATYSNYHQARRRFADLTVTPLWGEAADSLAHLVKAPGGHSNLRLACDTRGIAALQEDEKDAADILNVDAETTSTLWNAGFKPDSIKLAVAARDLSLLEHTGLDPVQAQPASDPKDKPESAAAKRRRKAAETKAA